MFSSIINKIIALGILILVVPGYCNKDIHLRTRSSQISTVDAPFKDFAVDEEYIFSFILKEDYKDESKCKARFEEYCKELREIDPGLDKVYTKIKEVCNNIEQKCKDLKTNIEKKIEQFADKLFSIVNDEIAYEACDKYLQSCLFVDVKDPSNPRNPWTIKEYCLTIIYKCIFFDRTKAIKEIFLRAYDNNITNSSDFKKKMEEVCPILIQQNIEFASECLLIDNSFNQLNTYIDYFCNSLNTNLNNNELQKVCYEKLGQCYFLKNKCGEKCNELKELCEKNNITYHFPRRDFSPIEPEETLLEKIGLEKFYIEQENKGIVFGNLETTLDQMLAIITLSSDRFTESTCKANLGDCNFFKLLVPGFNELCENNKARCKDMLEITDSCNKLKIELYLNGLSTALNKTSRQLFLDEVPRSLDRRECLRLLHTCYTLKKACKSSFPKERSDDMLHSCLNLQLSCFKKQQNLLFIKSIESQLREKQYELKLSNERLKICQKIVMENCATPGNNNIWSILTCFQPKKTCLELEGILHIQSKDLEQALDLARDSPREKDCVELRKDCETILKNFGSNNKKCATLNERCEYLRVTKELKNEFLKEKSNALANIQNCMRALKEKCDRLHRRGTNSFSVSCALPEETCKFMTSQVANHCNVFKNNIEKQDIVNKSKNGNGTLLEEICMLWDPYCDQLIENCPDKLKKENGNDGVCLQLKKNCEAFWKKKGLEDLLAYELKGSLSEENKCKEALEKHCSQWKEKGNSTFSTLCNTESGSTRDPKTELCKKLVKRIEKKCPSLKNDLEKMRNGLEKKKSELETLKDQAEDFMKKSSLLLTPKRNESVQAPAEPPLGPSEALSTPGGTSSKPSGRANTTDDLTKGTVVRRAFILDRGVSEAETEAFDVTARALELYLELREDCKGLQVKCGFRKECKDSEEHCKKMETLCAEVKLLEIKPHHREISTVTKTSTTTSVTTTMTTATTTATATATATVTKTETKSLGEGKVTEGCTLIRTTDTWVTKTSLHTSTTTSTSTVTQTVTLTSMKKCKPTKCTTDSSKETQKEQEEEVKPNEGMKMRVPGVIKIMLLGVIVMGMM